MLSREKRHIYLLQTQLHSVPEESVWVGIKITDNEVIPYIKTNQRIQCSIKALKFHSLLKAECSRRGKGALQVYSCMQVEVYSCMQIISVLKYKQART